MQEGCYGFLFNCKVLNVRFIDMKEEDRNEYRQTNRI